MQSGYCFNVLGAMLILIVGWIIAMIVVAAEFWQIMLFAITTALQTLNLTLVTMAFTQLLAELLAFLPKLPQPRKCCWSPEMYNLNRQFGGKSC